MKYQPPHEAKDKDKLEAMVNILKEGGQLPPIYVCGDIAYSGSHRLKAWDILDMDADVIEVDDSVIAQAMEAIGLEPGYDEITQFGRFEDALIDILT